MKTTLIGLAIIIGFLTAILITHWLFGVIYIAINNLFSTFHGVTLDYSIDNINECGVKMIRIVSLITIILGVSYLLSL